MFPKHIACVPKSRQALAPYNFVELPDKVVQAEELPPGDRYHPDRHTGKIECTLTTASPLYIRCGLTLDEFKQCKEAKDLPDFFYIFDKLKPVIPGSSIRGMLRTLVEISSFSKIDRVSGKQKFFFRAVAAKRDDPLANPYKTCLKNVGAGYLVKSNDGWYIRPARAIGDDPFVWIKEGTVSKKFPDFIPMTKADYRPQYIQNIGFGDIVTKNNRRFARQISPRPDGQEYIGVLVTSGNMAEGSDDPTSTTRKNHCLVHEPDTEAELIKISDAAIQDYCSSLTDFQKQSPPFREDLGVLENGRCIFYCQPEQQGGEVTLFGQSPNFRIPYSPQKNGRAASAEDFIPESLKDSKIVDFADAIFGFVRDKKQEEDSTQVVPGRVFISDTICQQTKGEDIWLSNSPIVPKILAGPKPTTFQHYLVQTKAGKRDLKHYGSAPGKETVIRGHKLYWHKDKNPAIRLENPEEVSDTQKTQIKPIKPGVSFQFTIHFENLSEVELGALLWVLDLAQNEQYRLSLGMGKPLGMGAVKITHKLYLNQRKQRYEKLFADGQWFTGYSAEPDSSKPYIDAFDAYIRQAIGATDESSLQDVRRIKMLLAMLSWTKAPPSDQTRYLEIERDASQPHIGTPKKGKVNEYADRPVLPAPLQVIGWEDCDDENDNPNSGNSGKGNSPKPNLPKPSKGDRSASKPQKSSSAGTGKTSMAAAFERATQRPKRP
jgi:CRISPR-associated protein (TIGR03986 family)